MKRQIESGSNRAPRQWADHLARWRWLVGLALAAAIGVAASWLAPSNEELEAVTGHHPSFKNPPPSTTEDLAWQSLTPDQRRILQPLQGIWASMDGQEQEVWRLVARHVQRKPHQLQNRLQKRMQKWAQLTPKERARARLNFMQIARRYGIQQREKEWSEYRRPRLEPRPRPLRAEQALRAEAPALVQIRPGATTVLLPQLKDAPAFEGESQASFSRPASAAGPVPEFSPAESGS